MQIVCRQIIELVYDICGTTFGHHALVVHTACGLTLLSHHVSIVAKFTNNYLLRIQEYTLVYNNKVFRIK